jgi:putative methionine-R-sulfoxide reductase with GAF domain
VATVPSAVGNSIAPVRPLPADLVDDLQRVQKAAQRITSILDLDQLIDSVVNEVADSFGCLEASIYLHDEARGEMVLAGVRGCSIHGKGHRLKVGREGMVGYVASSGQTRYAPDVRVDEYYIGCGPGTLSEVAIPLKRRRQPGWRIHGIASGIGWLPQTAVENPAGIVRSRRGRGAQRETIPIRARRARGHGPRSPGSASHTAGAATEEFSVHSRVCRFRA